MKSINTSDRLSIRKGVAGWLDKNIVLQDLCP